MFNKTELEMQKLNSHDVQKKKICICASVHLIATKALLFLHWTDYRQTRLTT